jgi:hypothetical protein
VIMGVGVHGGVGGGAAVLVCAGLVRGWLLRGARGLAAVWVGIVTEGKQSVTGGRVIMWKHGKKDACATCGGSGKIPLTGDGQDGSGSKSVPCPSCGGSGKA